MTIFVFMRIKITGRAETKSLHMCVNTSNIKCFGEETVPSLRKQSDLNSKM